MKVRFFLLLAILFGDGHAQLATNEAVDCGIHKKAIELAHLIISSKRQKRSELVCNADLARIATIKAGLLVAEEKIDHNVDHTTPNQLLRREGFLLPAEYSVLGNQVESILGGKGTAQQAFDYFMTSEIHKNHLLGEGEYFLSQNQIGVAYQEDPDTPHVDYWVVFVTGMKD